MGRTTKRAPPGRTNNGVRKTAKLSKKIQSAAQTVLDNLEARKVGAPSKYHPGFCHLAEQTAIINATDMNLAELFGTYPTSIVDWMKAHPQFAKAIQRGKDFADSQIEAALAHRARGYSHPEMHVSNYLGDVTLTPITKHYPPDTAAAFIWLKNRKSGLWKDRQPEGSEGTDTPPPIKVEITFKDARKIPVDELLSIKKKE